MKTPEDVDVWSVSVDAYVLYDAVWALYSIRSVFNGQPRTTHRGDRLLSTYSSRSIFRNSDLLQCGDKIC